MRRLHGLVRRGVLSLGAFALAGCHTYLPVERPEPGQIVRIQVPVRSAITNRNAPSESASIEGRVVTFGDTLVLATESRTEIGAFREIRQVDTVRVSPEQLSAMDVRVFSTGRSVALGVALGGGAVVLALAALGIEGGQAGDGPPDVGGNPSGTILVSSIVSTLWRLVGG